MSLNHIKVLTYADVPKAAVTLLEAFSDDYLAKYLVCHIKGEPERKYCEYKLYEAYLRQHIDFGIVLGVGELKDKFETVALWSLPDSYEKGIESFSTLMKSGFGEVWDIYGDDGRHKVFDGLLPLLHDACERIISNDRRFFNKNLYTLVYVGSTQESRGKGNLRKIFDYMFVNYMDKDPHSLAYLESSSPDNIPIYNRFGFHVYEDIVLGNKGPGAVEGLDYAVMNVMIRRSKAYNWTLDNKSDVHAAKL